MGKEMDELEAMLPDDEPQSDLDRAESLTDGIPFLLLSGASVGNVKKLAKELRFVPELTDVVDQLEDIESRGGDPWWVIFEEDRK